MFRLCNYSIINAAGFALIYYNHKMLWSPSYYIIFLAFYIGVSLS